MQKQRGSSDQGQAETLLKKVTDTADAPKGRDISYRCLKCGDTIPSQPQDSVACRCGNVVIDVDYHRLFVEDYEYFQPLKVTHAV